MNTDRFKVGRRGPIVIVVLAAMLVGMLSAAGCADDVQAPAEADEPTFRPLAYMMLLDSSLVVIDVLGMRKVDKIKIGHLAVHQVAVLPDNRTVYTGNVDNDTIVKLRFSEDGTTHTTKVVGKSPVTMHFFESSPDGKHVVVTSRHELEAVMHAPDPSHLPDDSIAIIDTTTDKIIKTLALQSPAMPSFANDGKYLYINNVHHASISVIETKTWTEIQRVSILDKPLELHKDGTPRVSPDGLHVSPDGKWVVSGDYEARSISVYEVGADGKLGTKRVVPYASEWGMPHDVRFSADSNEVWVTDYDRLPNPADEVGNASIVTHIRVFDIDSLEVKRKFDMPRSVGRVVLPQYSKLAYLTTAVGSLLAIERDTGKLRGEIAAGQLGNPVICGMSSY
jgi:YVTN family beta-propeller protein